MNYGGGLIAFAFEPVSTNSFLYDRYARCLKPGRKWAICVFEILGGCFTFTLDASHHAYVFRYKELQASEPPKGRIKATTEKYKRKEPKVFHTLRVRDSIFCGIPPQGFCSWMLKSTSPPGLSVDPASICKQSMQKQHGYQGAPRKTNQGCALLRFNFRHGELLR